MTSMAAIDSSLLAAAKLGALEVMYAQVVIHARVHTFMLAYVCMYVYILRASMHESMHTFTRPAQSRVSCNLTAVTCFLHFWVCLSMSVRCEEQQACAITLLCKPPQMFP
jgi:hypothetical protein